MILVQILNDLNCIEISREFFLNMKLQQKHVQKL